MTAIIDYGAGNIFSVKNALDFLGADCKLTDNPQDIINADKLILPGVGAFPWAMKKLEESGLIEVIKEETLKKPLLGICLGMQLLFTKGFEFEECNGLDLIPGKVEKIDVPLIIPHMGWNELKPLAESKWDIKDKYVYFVHSYQAVCEDKYISYYCEYGKKIPAMVQKDNVIGCQFHPEKSGEVGLNILRKFIEI
ncbi:MAG: imidazole glycerol phosphate synthase subunit HisH [Oscillospiraceae bacterium]|jgi:glutamine amidotransferase|nr:imidazole glycerol phosphate synthase subunit HisH [Oscillospiraceae bacterium]